MITMDNIIREGHPTLRKRAEKLTFPLSEEDQKLAHDLMEFLENSQDEKIAEKYEYPLMPEWSKDEIITMVEFYAQVEDAYTTGVAKDEFMKMVQKFKAIEPSIATQKQLDRKFKELSGYSIYQAIKTVSNSSKEHVKVEK